MPSPKDASFLSRYPYVRICRDFITLLQKRFYNRKKITVWNNEIHQMSFIPPFLSMQLKKNIYFLNSSISTNHEKEENFSQS